MSVANPSLRQYSILNPKLYIFYSLLGLQTEASYRTYSKQQCRWDSGPESPALMASCLKEPYPLSDAAVIFALSCGLSRSLEKACSMPRSLTFTESESLICHYTRYHALKSTRIFHQLSLKRILEQCLE